MSFVRLLYAVVRIAILCGCRGVNSAYCRGWLGLECESAATVPRATPAASDHANADQDCAHAALFGRRNRRTGRPGCRNSRCIPYGAAAVPTGFAAPFCCWSGLGCELRFARLGLLLCDCAASGASGSAASGGAASVAGSASRFSCFGSPAATASAPNGAGTACCKGAAAAFIKEPLEQGRASDRSFCQPSSDSHVDSPNPQQFASLGWRVSRPHAAFSET